MVNKELNNVFKYIIHVSISFPSKDHMIIKYIISTSLPNSPLSPPQPPPRPSRSGRGWVTPCSTPSASCALTTRTPTRALSSASATRSPRRSPGSSCRRPRSPANCPSDDPGPGHPETIWQSVQRVGCLGVGVTFRLGGAHLSFERPLWYVKWALGRKVEGSKPLIPTVGPDVPFCAILSIWFCKFLETGLWIMLIPWRGPSGMVNGYLVETIWIQFPLSVANVPC